MTDIVPYIPYIFSVSIELSSPRTTNYLNRYLNTQLNSLRDDQIGPDAKVEIMEFTTFAFNILQLGTAMLVSLASSIQLFYNQGWYLGYLAIFWFLILSLGFDALNGDMLSDSALYQMYIEKYRYSPSSIATIIVNLFFILLIHFFS